MRIYPTNLIDAAGVDITPVTEETAMPASHLANAQRTLLYRCLATVAGEAVVFDLGSAQAADALILLDHTILNTATITLQANSADSWGAPAFTSAVTWQASWILHSFASQTYRYWRLTVTKASAATQFDIGRLFLGAVVSPADPPDFDGLDRQILDLSTSQRSISGQLYCDPRSQARRLELDFTWIRDAQKAQFLAAAEDLGTHTPFFVRVDETASDELTEPIYVRLREVPRFKLAGFDGANFWDTKLSLEEAL